IVDARGRKSSGRHPDDDDDDDDDEGRAPTARADSGLATLGYPRVPSDRGVSLNTFLGYGGAALAAGFLGLWLLISIATPAAPPPKPSASRLTAQRRPTSAPPLTGRTAAS